MASRDERVYVVGVGACTPLGYSASAAFTAVRAGISALGEHPFLVDRAGEKMIVARVDALPTGLALAPRMAAMALAAAAEALSPLRRQPYGGAAEVPAILGLPATRPASAVDLAQGFVEAWHAARQQTGTGALSTFTTGNAAGLMALASGFSQIQEGETEFCLVGGVDSYLDAETLEWLDQTGQLHSEANIWGFAPGEAAGFCLLASERAMRRHSLQPLLQITAVATATETKLIRTETICTGRGLSEAFRGALSGLPGPEDKVHQTICDMNGERYRADELAFTICRTSERFVDASRFLAPADCWGDVGAASGPLFVGLAAAAAAKGYAPGPNALLWASSDTGERAAALVSGEV